MQSSPATRDRQNKESVPPSSCLFYFILIFLALDFGKCEFCHFDLKNGILLKFLGDGAR